MKKKLFKNSSFIFFLFIIILFVIINLVPSLLAKTNKNDVKLIGPSQITFGNTFPISDETGKIIDASNLKKNLLGEEAFTIVGTGDKNRKVNYEIYLIKEDSSKIKEDYILIYNLNRSKEFDDYAEELAKRTGYKLYRFCTRLDQVFRNGKSLVMPEIFDFITLVDNAKIVLTDSFHATAFSINLNTEPICIYPQSYSGRLSSFLKLVDSEQRHAKDYQDFDVVNRHVDFEKVNKILDKEREKVDQYLQEIVDKYKEDNKDE